MKQLKVPILRPDSFSFYILSVNKERLHHSRISSTKTFLTERARQELMAEIAEEELSSVEKELLMRAETILKIEKPIHGELFSTLKQTLEEAVYLADRNLVLDMEQGARLLVDLLDTDQPLSAGTILRIRAYKKDCFELFTSGMKRFGLPELALSDIPVNLGADAAYLMRTIASYLVVRMDVSPAGEYLYLLPGSDEDLQIPVSCCELDNPLFKTRTDYLPGIRLRLMDDREKLPYMEISEPSGYEDKIDWFIDIVARLREIRSDIRWQEATGLSCRAARSA